MKAYKFKIKASKSVELIFEQTLDLCRELYNAALQERRDAWKLNRISVNYHSQSAQLPDIKMSRPEFNSIYSQILQDVLRKVSKSFDSFFRRIKNRGTPGFPRFKGRRFFRSFTYPQSGFALTGNNLTLSKMGSVRIRLSRTMQGKVKTCTIKKEISGWFVVFVVENTPDVLPTTNQQVGIDIGIESFATLSDGTQIDNGKYYESSQKELRRTQRSVARKKKGSNSRNKAALRLRKIHQRISNRRADFQHKISIHLVKSYDLIVIEKLNIKGMSKGILSKQIHDASWSSFFHMLRYKAENAGRKLVEVNPAYTSQDCSGCGNRVKKDLSVRVHNCSACGMSLHRDHNAALNILSLGLRELDLTKAAGL